MNKKGLELSVNFLVVVIISLVILGFGIQFVTKIFGGAKDIQEITSEDLDSQIGSLMCEGNQRVCFGFNKKTVKRGELGVFGIKITNILEGENKDFYIIMKKSIAIDNKGNPMTHAKVECVPECGKPRIEKIDRFESQELGLGIKVEKGALPGTYTFDVTICKDAPTCERGSENFYEFDQIHVEVP